MVELTIIEPNRELGTLDVEAINIADCVLDAIGYPEGVEIQAKAISLEREP